MHKTRRGLSLGMIAAVVLVACGPGSSQGDTLATDATVSMSTVPASTSSATTSPASTTIGSTSTTTSTTRPVGRAIVVTSVADDGPGSLRVALEGALPGDTITFDPARFAPQQPAAITVLSSLPPITHDYVSLDASNAGVIVDGGGLAGHGLLVESSHNVIRGLQVTGFSGPGLRLESNAHFNVVGGDRRIGLGPTGEGNLVSGCNDGIQVLGSDNTITGNLIGTDVTGLSEFGNEGPGVVLEGQATGNVIGPGNILAFNGMVGGGGVEIRSVEARGNVITANEIHDNSFPGITYNDEAWTWGRPGVPVIADFDLDAGLVSGLSCPGCTVEIFSTRYRDGEIFEGTVEADTTGGFTFDAGRALAGPMLTATSSAPNENTSEFAPPHHVHRSSVLQMGNDRARTPIEHKPSWDLIGNRIGHPLDHLNFECSEEAYAATVALGLTTVRVSSDHGDSTTALEEMAYSRFEVNPCLDRLVTLWAENGVTVVYMIVFWDEALGVRGFSPDYGNAAEVDAYLEYVRFTVHHFRDRVRYFEILNEPVNWLEAEDYINLVREAEKVIHGESPGARVVAGSVPYLTTTLGPPDRVSSPFLSALLRTDVMPLIDAINLHPMYGTSPDYADIRDYYYGYPEMIAEIKAEAEAHGFAGEFLAEEMIWRTAVNPHPNEPWQYTEPVAAKHYIRGIVINRGLGLWAGIAAEFPQQPQVSFVIRNMTSTMDGAEPEPLQAVIESDADNIASYTFTTPGGDRLLALWTDGIALDYDPGVETTVTFPRFSAREVTAIDPYAGIQQPLVFESGSGDTVVRSIVVKDYPIFIRLTP